MSTPSPLADCCPECDPFDSSASLPTVVTEEPDNPGSLAAFYRCPGGHSWTTWWDREAAGWPIERKAA